MVIRHWIADRCTLMASWTRPMAAKSSPAAIRSWARTRSIPVTSSVTVCSTWIRGFISMNAYPKPDTCLAARACGSAHTRNSTVPAEQ